MLTINDKLRLISEGYTISEINTNRDRFSDLITEGVQNPNEFNMMLEAVNLDLVFINETHVEYLQESVLDTLKDKVNKFFSWIIEKIMNIIRWIKSKFVKKTQEVNVVSVSVKNKVKSGELRQTISAIKSGNVEKYKEIKDKSNSSSSNTGKTELDITSLRGTIVDPSKFDNFVKNDLYNRDPSETIQTTIPEKEILKVSIKKRLIDNTVPDISEIANNITRIVSTSLKNVENFRVAIVKGTSNGKLNGEDSINDLLLNLSTGNKISRTDQLKGYILGDSKEIELSVEDAEKMSNLLQKFEKEGEEIFKAYNEMKNLLDEWKHKASDIIDKYKDSSEVRPETITKRVQQMIQLITGAVTILNNLLSLKSEGLSECEMVLRKLDSL